LNPAAVNSSPVSSRACNRRIVAQPVRSTIAAIVNRAMFVTERLSNILMLRCAMCCADKTSSAVPST
jgi:hypothetical protein